ncbi:MAG TPA: hypothetical protein VM101_07630, partial [Flavitalea sp.]|nr:hypothetical protein [Flavitalea sp.]
MNRPFLMSAVIVLFVSSCGEKNQPVQNVTESAATTSGDTSKAETRYFPVYEFISNETEYVDSTPVGIMKYSTIGKVKDSGYIPLEEFHTLVAQFHLPELKEPLFSKKFNEISFVDKSNGHATFFYTARDTGIQLKRIDIVTARGEVYDEVKSLYIEKNIYN